MRHTLALILLVLAGCRTTPALPQPPKVVYVTVDRYVKFDPALLADCPVYEATEQSVAEAKRLALLRRESLLLCNKDKARMRELEEQATKGAEKQTNGVQPSPSSP